MKYTTACFVAFAHFCCASLPTSSSDRPSYLSVCEEAARDSFLFETFKRHPEYKRVLEHVSEKQGGEYLSYIKAHYPDLLTHWRAFAENDTIGSPQLFLYPDIGWCSPTTLRYVKVAGDLREAFGTLDGKCIVEIGGGYGGQCKVISELFAFDQYTIIDLPEPLALANQCLAILAVPSYILTPPDKVEEIKDSLVISNFAFSECVRDVQNFYFERIIKPSQEGYMTWNDYTHVASLAPYPLAEIVSRLESYGFVVSVTLEEPLTHPSNRIIIWRKPV